MRATPGRLAALEARVAALEAAQASKPAAKTPCEYCGGELKLVDERPDLVLGKAGVMLQHWACLGCGKEQRRMRKMI